MNRISFERLLEEIYRLKEDKRFKYNDKAIEALEAVMFWAEEENIPTINERL